MNIRELLKKTTLAAILCATMATSALQLPYSSIFCKRMGFYIMKTERNASMIAHL